jgi:DNA-binding transcriptional LysR family regulator
MANGTTMDWDKLKVFHAAAEAGSFTHAGERLGLSQSAVSRQVSALESELSVSLFHRHARGLILTEQGELLYRTAHEVFMKLEAARTKLTDSRERPNGELKVSTTPGIGVDWLTPKLGEFLDLYPDIQITLITSEEELDLAMREADVAIRLRQPTQPDLIQRKLFSVHFHAYASPDYLKRFGTPRTHEELDKHRIVLLGGHVPPHFQNRRFLLEAGREGKGERTPSFTVNNVLGAVSASRCFPITSSRRTAASCSCSVTRRRSRSTPSSSIRKSSSRWRACRCFATFSSPTRSAGISSVVVQKLLFEDAAKHGRTSDSRLWRASFGIADMRRSALFARLGCGY